MKLILTAEVEKLGVPGDTVEVKDGYGRNFLLPRGLAIVATRGAEKQVEGIRRAQDARAVRGLEHANELKQKLESMTDVKVAVKTSDTGKLFGSVTAGDVAFTLNLLKAKGHPSYRLTLNELVSATAEGDDIAVVQLSPRRGAPSRGIAGTKKGDRSRPFS